MSVQKTLQVDQGAGHVVRLVGHELRNKLSIMSNSVFFLRMKTDQSDAKLAKHMAILGREIATSNRIMLSLTDLVAARQPTRSSVNLIEVMERALGECPAPAGTTIRREFADELPLVSADGEQLARAVGGVLGYQYGGLRPGDTLRLVARCDAKHVYVEAIDSGLGMSREGLEQLLDSRHLDSMASERLGVLAARRLVELNGGILEAESRPGMGTRFSMVFPAGLTDHSDGPPAGDGVQR